MAKIRNGFVSNSSSSSFVIIGNNIDIAKKLIDENGGYDYYELDDKLYTSFISDCSDFYGVICDLSGDSYEGDYGHPYDEESFKEVEGDRGFASVFIPKEVVTKSNLTKLYEELLSLDNIEVYNIINKYRRVFNEN